MTTHHCRHGNTVGLTTTARTRHRAYVVIARLSSCRLCDEEGPTIAASPATVIIPPAPAPLRFWAD